MIDEVGHDRLRLGTIPRDVSRLSESVPIDSFVSLMIDGSLPSSPLSVGIRNWRVLGKSPAEIPPEEIWVVQQGSCVELMVVEDDWSLISQTSSESLRHKDDQVEVSQPASNIEILNRELSNNSQT